MTEYLYPLSSTLKSCEYVDSLDSSFLKQSHTPIIKPLNFLLQIDLYNTNGFIANVKGPLLFLLIPILCLIIQ